MFQWNKQNCIWLKNLCYSVFIGVYENEKQQRQPIWIDCALSFDFQRACQEDHFAATIDYEAVQLCFQEVTQQRHYFLLEALAYTLGQELFNRFSPLQSVRLFLKKPQALSQLGAYPMVELHLERP